MHHYWPSLMSGHHHYWLPVPVAPYMSARHYSLAPLQPPLTSGTEVPSCCAMQGSPRLPVASSASSRSMLSRHHGEAGHSFAEAADECANPPPTEPAGPAYDEQAHFPARPRKVPVKCTSFGGDDCLRSVDSTLRCVLAPAACRHHIPLILTRLHNFLRPPGPQKEQPGYPCQDAPAASPARRAACVQRQAAPHLPCSLEGGAGSHRYATGSDINGFTTMP